MTRFGVQLHTFREVDTSLPALLYEVAESGFEGVEFGDWVHEADTEQVAKALADTGLVPIGAHVDLPQVEEELEPLVRQYRALGCSTLVIRHLPANYFFSFDRIEVLGRRLADLADRLDDRGFDLVLHNSKAMHYPVIGRYGFDRIIESGILPEGAWPPVTTALSQTLPGRLSGITGFDHLVKATEGSGIRIEIDVEHAVGVGRDPHHLFERVGDRLFAVHISDGLQTRRFPPAYRSTPLGDGDVDIKRGIRGAIRHDAEWLIGEVDDHPEPHTATQSIIETIETAAPPRE